MKFGIFTPTNNARWLAEAHASIHGDCVWCIAINGGLTREQLPAEILNDQRARVIVAPRAFDGIGALKTLACDRLLSYGCDMLVELDHDDQLSPDCLPELAAAAERTPGAFYYSDTVRLKADGTCQAFARNYGWDYYPTDGSRFAVRAFPATARSLCEIFYAPDHVRAWSREAYTASGGHAASLPVTDDQELIHRTYLAGVPFVHIPKPLYTYRVHPSTSSVDLNAEIQVRQAGHRNRNMAALALEQCRREGRLAVDFGGAHNSPKGWTSLDLRAGAAIQADALTWLRAQPTSSIGAMRAADFLEHLPPAAVVPFMNEAWRALMPGGMFFTSTPSTDGRGAFQDPTHVSFWNSNSWWYFTRSAQARYVPEIVAKFQPVRIETGFPSKWHEENNIPYVIADVCAWKSAAQPGPAYL